MQGNGSYKARQGICLFKSTSIHSKYTTYLIVSQLIFNYPLNYSNKQVHHQINLCLFYLIGFVHLIMFVLALFIVYFYCLIPSNQYFQYLFVAFACVTEGMTFP